MTVWNDAPYENPPNCDDCGAEMSGALPTFTCCDVCWTKHIATQSERDALKAEIDRLHHNSEIQLAALKLQLESERVAMRTLQGQLKIAIFNERELLARLEGLKP